MYKLIKNQVDVADALFLFIEILAENEVAKLQSRERKD